MAAPKKEERPPLTPEEERTALIAEQQKVLDERAATPPAEQPKPARVANAAPGWRYYWFSIRASDREQKPLGAGILDSQRAELRDELYVPVNGPQYKGDPGLEFVPGVPGAEIWRTPIETWERRKADRMNELYTAKEHEVWRQTQVARRQPQGVGYLPPKIAENTLRGLQPGS